MKDVRRRYEALKDRVGERREAFLAFVAMLERETSWLTSPASTRFHLNVEGGLLRHSVGVTETLLELRSTLVPEISEESCVIVGLFHDVGKVGMPGRPQYLSNDNQWEREKRGMTYKVNDQLVYLGVAVRSLYLVTKYIPLTDSEAQAIVYHDGQYIEDNRCVGLREEPLLLLLHWADYWTMHIIEDEWEVGADEPRYDRPAAGG
ncbi:MAG: phosphohydrolase [bacterium]